MLRLVYARLYETFETKHAVLACQRDDAAAVGEKFEEGDSGPDVTASKISR